MNTVSIHWMNVWFQYKKHQPEFLDLIDNKETEDKTLISETRNEIKKSKNYINTWNVYLQI